MIEQPKNPTQGNRDKYFKGQQFNEELICFFRKHWVTVLPHIAMGLLLGIIELGFILGFTKVSPFLKESTFFALVYVAVVILLTVYLHKTFFRIFGHFMDTYMFTNSRIIDHKKTVILHNSHEMLDVVKIQDIQKSQDGFWRNLLRYGDLVITLSSSKASKSLSYVPNVNFHYRCLSRTKRDAALRYNHLRSQNTVSKKFSENRAIRDAIKTEEFLIDQAIEFEGRVHAVFDA
ncbi:hypothetical protein HOE67_02885 [Candidatus Peregrinibacteria bacterium]|jgi:hypothetical protein|nr:hypothetical protein [Candidatus Peregrinibacteria bacterium]MBT4056032.1 hypothetical protein [Candidatus Peregrinibacteria bacterium]